MTNTKNLIVGIAANYNRFNILVFVESLRKTGCLDDIVLFETNFTPKCYQFCQDNNVKTIKISSHYPWFIDENYLSELRKLDLSVRFPAHFIRFFLIEAFLKGNHEYSNIIISDVRDVFFQLNPFEVPSKNDELNCFLESEVITIGKEPINAAWVKNGYSEQGLAEIENNSISCCGLVVGDAAGIGRYVRIMCDEFERLVNTKVKIGFDGVMEQASHNYLLRNGKFNPVNIIPDDAGLVSTLSYFKPDNQIHLNSKHQITNASGTVIPIVHQYDRFADVERKILRKLSLRANIYVFATKRAKWLLPILRLIF